MKKKWVTYTIFTVVLTLGLVGGSWSTSLAQGTIPPDPPAPEPAPPLIGAIVTAGIGHSCSITPTTGLRCWGLNDSGQVGDATFVDKLVSTPVEDPPALDIVDLQSGIKHTCALTAGGRVFCWGLNDKGQLGDGSNENRNTPVWVEGIAGVVEEISAGAKFTCAKTTADRIFCWGENNAGQLNDGTTDDKNVATQVDYDLVDNVLQLSGGMRELQGITFNGVFNYWNLEPQIPVTGLEELEHRILSADRFFEGGCQTTKDKEVECWGAIVDADVDNATLDKRFLDSGGGHACTIDERGLVCWGNNSDGQLGDESYVDSENAVVVVEAGDIADLAAGLNHTCVVYTERPDASGEVPYSLTKCWGDNTYGQVGNNTLEDVNKPVYVH